MSTRLEILKSYLKEEPSDSFLRYALALEFIAINDHQSASRELEQLLNENPDYLPAYYMAGKTYEELKEIERAKDYYLRGIELAKMLKNTHTLNELNAALEQLD
jgi:Tfp pilus assembly protein PilF